MKKRGLVVMLLLVMMVPSVALAEITYFSVVEIPTGTGTPLMDWAPIYHRPCTGIYVRHYILDEGGIISTSYITVGLNGNQGNEFGGKWVQPDTAVIITSAVIANASTYRVIMRINADNGLGFARVAGYAEPLH